MQQTLRLFTIRGVEFYDHDNPSQLKLFDCLFYSFGDDYDYSVRLGQLQFIRELGVGGFGVVNLMHDQLEKLDVAVKFISFR